MQKQAPQMKDKTKLETQASIMLGPQLSMDRADNILTRFSSGSKQTLGVEGDIYIIKEVIKDFFVLKLLGFFEGNPTAYFIKKVLSVYTHSMTTIYLSLSAQVAKSTFFMKSPVSNRELAW